VCVLMCICVLMRVCVNACVCVLMHVCVSVCVCMALLYFPAISAFCCDSPSSVPGFRCSPTFLLLDYAKTVLHHYALPLCSFTMLKQAGSTPI